MPAPKRESTIDKRVGRITSYMLVIKNIEVQKHLIISQPIAPKFKEGCKIVGKSSLILKDK